MQDVLYAVLGNHHCQLLFTKGIKGITREGRAHAYAGAQARLPCSWVLALLV